MIVATGGSQSGNGGLAEVSGAGIDPSIALGNLLASLGPAVGKKGGSPSALNLLPTVGSAPAPLPGLGGTGSGGSIGPITKGSELLRGGGVGGLLGSATAGRGAVQGVGLIRFNPFEGKGQGGNQSFALALLDEHHSGVVFSTLYSRDRVGVYGKNVEGGTSSYDLTPEEKAAIEQAVRAIAKKRGS